MNDKKKLANLLKGLPRSYPDFWRILPDFTEEYGITSDVIAFIEASENPDANTVSTEAVRLSGITKPLPIIN